MGTPSPASVAREATGAIVTALEAAGFEILSTDRLFLTTQLQRLTNETLAAVVTAIVANIKGGGLIGLAAPMIRTALANSVPTLQNLADQKEVKVLDDLYSYLAYLLQSPQSSTKGPQHGTNRPQ
jgi:hypothetical protein